MKDYQVKTYDEAIKVIEEVGILPLAPLFPDLPSLQSITLTESWHSDTEHDPWAWRTRFAAEGVAGYGKFIKKKGIFISTQFLPYVKSVLGSYQSINDRYKAGVLSREAYKIYHIISENEGIDTRELRLQADMKAKEKKKEFDQALLELQSSIDIVISGIHQKVDADGETNGWSSTAFETFDHWVETNQIDVQHMEREEGKQFLLSHFEKLGSEATMKTMGKIFK